MYFLCVKLPSVCPDKSESNIIVCMRQRRSTTAIFLDETEKAKQIKKHTTHTKENMLTVRLFLSL